MTTLFIIAALAIPFTAELLATPMAIKDERRAAFYWLTPIMGLLVYTGFLIITAHPYLALAGSTLYYFGLTAISNKKYEILGDPFNAHDFDNARNLYIYPEFYISHVGWPILGLISLMLAAIIGSSLYFEDPITLYEFGPWYLVWPITVLGWFAMLRLLAWAITQFFTEASASQAGLSLSLQTDIARFGLFPTILLYRLLLKHKTDKKSLRQRPIKAQITTAKPADIIAVQGESYFDLERFFSKVEHGAKWSLLDTLRKQGVTTGQIGVPAWGAYTMQTEFSFLSGLRNDVLGIDSINPYMRLAQKPVSTFVEALREAGYHTICIHPAKKEFFRRAHVMPNLGFDDFIGIEAFDKPHLFGKYISDDTLADKIDEITKAHHSISKQPLFIFAITIESHGPWAKDRLTPHLPANTSEADLLAANITDDHEFTLYQAHMENLISFYRRLTVERPPNTPDRVVAMYGDHMPALGRLFGHHGFTDKPVDYLLWSSRNTAREYGKQKIETFSKTMLAEADIKLD